MSVCAGSISSCSKDDTEENKPVVNNDGDSSNNSGGNSGDNSGGNSGGKSGITDGHEWVDLGLPSGTLWATCNVGASKPEEYGDYFAWGETETKENFDWSTYKYCNGSYTTMTKYCTHSTHGHFGTEDNKTELEATDDAATVKWGNGWQMPSDAQFNELIANTTSEWTTENGIKGRKITSKNNGIKIFLPGAGTFMEGTNFYGDNSGRYWSRTLHVNYPSMARGLGISNSQRDGIRTDSDSDRCCGQSIRPVRKQ